MWACVYNQFNHFLCEQELFKSSICSLLPAPFYLNGISSRGSSLFLLWVATDFLVMVEVLLCF
uniref:Uncharacterized protein n=1 Tax=Manihot esculenta TaxID=3983 RepID=A0A2C9UJA9_MANES